MVVIVAPSAWTASIVHDFTDSPSTSTVHAPHDERVAADVRAGEPEHVPEVVDEQRARFDVVALLHPVHGHRNVHRTTPRRPRARPIMDRGRARHRLTVSTRQLGARTATRETIPAVGHRFDDRDTHAGAVDRAGNHRCPRLSPQ